MNALEQLEQNPDAFYHQLLSDWQRRLWQGELDILAAPRDVCFQPQAEMHFHSHPEIFIQVQGCNEFLFPNGSMDLDAGSIGIVSSGVPHGETFVPKDGLFLCIVIMPNHYHLGILTALCSIEDGRLHKHTSQHRRYEVVDLNQVSGLLNHCQHFIKTDMNSSRHIMAAILSLFLGAMKDPRPDEDRDHSPLIHQCRALVQERFYESQCNVQSLATQLSCTPNYLSAKYKRECGNSLSNFINQVRLNHASDLLINSDLSVQHIAWSCGYNSTSYFISLFQKSFGETPGNFKAYKRNVIGPNSP